jgi:two-component system, chemotaxis family, chemotaxis protein CheY
MPLLSGAELVRIVRSAGVFPIPDVPIIMLSAHGERWRVVEAVKLGVNEHLVKPLSAKAPPLVDHDAAAPGGAARRLLRSPAA